MFSASNRSPNPQSASPALSFISTSELFVPGPIENPTGILSRARLPGASFVDDQTVCRGKPCPGGPMRIRTIPVSSASSKPTVNSALRFPLRVAPTGNEHLAVGVDVENGVLVTVTFVNRVGRKPPVPPAIYVEFETIHARIELHGFAPDTVGVGPAHRKCGVG